MADMICLFCLIERLLTGQICSPLEFHTVARERKATLAGFAKQLGDRRSLQGKIAF